LHIFSHSIDAGMFLGYHDNAINALRSATLGNPDGTARKAKYAEVVAAEVGSILTDHLLISPFSSSKGAARAVFAKDAIIKIWGCNSGVVNWSYWDGDPPAPYYWSALNKQNVPKPALAQAFADYFNQTTLWCQKQCKHSGVSQGHVEKRGCL
jgi:hypothetical protein